MLNLVHGSWGAWADWAISANNTGTKTRKRQCNNPKPQNGGLPCEGEGTQENELSDDELPGNWNK